MIIWGYPIWFYLWLAGMGAGAYFAAFLAERFGKHDDNRFLHTSLYLGLPAAIIGVSFLLLDLSYPLRFWRLFTNFNLSSPMSVGSWLLVLWIAIGMAILFFWHLRNRLPVKPEARKKISNLLQWAGFFSSILLMVYTGVLLASSNQPLWASTVFLPPLFVVSAVSTGAALLVLASLMNRMWKTHGETVRQMVKVDAVIIVIELIVLALYFFWLYRSGFPGAAEAMIRLTTGVLAIPFWIGVVLMAIVLPFTLYTINWGKRIGERKGVFASVMASSLSVVIGGLVLRTVIVIGGQL